MANDETPVPAPQKEALDERVVALVREMTGPTTEAATRLAEAADRMSASRETPQAMGPQKTAEQVRAEFDQIANEKGTGAALEFYSQSIVGPAAMAIVGQTAGHVAKLQKQVAEKDPELKPLMRRYSKEIAEAVRGRGGDSWIAENGYEGLVREIAGKDPKYVEEKDAALKKTAVDEYIAAHPQPGAPGPSQEGVSIVPVVASPTPKPNDDAALAAIQITAEEMEVAGPVFGMTKRDAQIQKQEIAAWTVKAGGKIGLKKMGGVPICSYAEIGLPEPRTIGGE